MRSSQRSSIFQPSMMVAYILFGAIICATAASDDAFKNVPGIRNCNITDVNRTTGESYVLSYACESDDRLMYTMKLSYVPEESLVIEKQCTGEQLRSRYQDNEIELYSLSLFNNQRSDLSPLLKSLLTMKMRFLNCSFVSDGFVIATEPALQVSKQFQLGFSRRNSHRNRSFGRSWAFESENDFDFSEQPEIIWRLEINAEKMEKSSIISIEEMINLMYLVLTATELTLDDIEFVKNLEKLRQLSLHGKRMNSIPSGFFDKMTKLRRLAMRGNQISTLDEGLFLRNKYLQMIDFSHNHLTSINYKVFEGPDDLKHILIGGNRIDKEQIRALKSRLNSTVIHA